MSVDSQGLAPAAAPPELRRTLSVVGLTAFGIGSIIGTGIFVLTGTAAANQAGPALVLSFVIAGCSCALVALCYAELAAMIPVSGSAYSYAHAAFGEILAWFIGWNLVLEYTFSVATVSVGWSGYVASLLAQFGLHLPSALAQAPFDRGVGQLRYRDHGRLGERSGGAHRRRYRDPVLCRHPRVLGHEHDHRRPENRGDRPLHPRRGELYPSRSIGTRSFRRIPATSASSAGAAWSPARG